MNTSNLIIIQNNTIKQALVYLNNSGLGILFVTNFENKLIGIITDGDIRRALLKNFKIEDLVLDIMNSNFVSLPVGTDNSIVLEKISNSVKIIPLVNEINEVVDFASIHKLRRISVASPLLDGNELAYITECIKTNWISSQGKFVKKFEEQFSIYHDNLPSLAVSNGTVAIHLALEALGIKSGDEVLVPDLTFAASVNSILYTGATPVLVDVNYDTWNIETNNLESYLTDKTKAILIVHLYGNPCDMNYILSFAKKYNLLLIEDCAEALGSFYNGKPVGTFGDASTFSFYGNKTITTGEGGMVLFKDPSIAEYASTLRDHGMSKTKRYWHCYVGYNYRLTNLQAAIGVAQFERLEEFVSAKRHIAKRYIDTLTKFSFFKISTEINNTVNSYWLFTFLIVEGSPFKREELMDYLNYQGIETRPVFYPMHKMPPYIDFGKEEKLQNSLKISNEGMSLPSSVNLSDEEINHICNSIESFCKISKNKI